jgi:hypothetical protein
VRKTEVHFGQRFNRFTVVREVTNGVNPRRFLCRCDCDEERIVLLKDLKNGHTRSCGCLKSEKAAKRQYRHGLRGHSSYNTWKSMLARCRRDPRYRDRGITVCDRWRDIRNFVADMGEKPNRYELDRIDNDGGYEPSNCRWATSSENGRNTRVNHLLTFNNKTKTAVEWSEYTGIKYPTLTSRVNRLRWPEERALTEPVRFQSKIA